VQIGELARRTGVSVRSLRHYEQSGVLVSVRQENGYRQYAESAVERVRAIQSLLGNGLTPCYEGSGAPALCEKATAAYQRKVAELDERIRSLQDLRARILHHIGPMCRRGRRRGPPLRCPALTSTVRPAGRSDGKISKHCSPTVSAWGTSVGRVPSLGSIPARSPEGTNLSLFAR
jgi:DNA-binding transcriptional MerR regulator